jgi:Domain of unknown function (DUF1844)
MSKEREPEFVVTDRRRFTSEGENNTDRPEDAPAETEERTTTKTEPAAPVSTAPPTPPPTAAAPEPSPPEAGEAAPEAAPEYDAPSAEERKAQEDAFRASTQQLDKQMETALGGRAQDLQMSFERFVASIYMSALMQLGLMREQSGPPPQVDLLGARQTIDTLSILSEKTKGNLSLQEDTLLQNCLYELRMAYVEVTNAITRAPQPGAGGLGGRK